ncbi:L-gulonolactone/D-arabinono-1,4-lactone oxidase [Auriculariales sp. MPI-PUGE-AT-0066]|nr:L-gulonolactone/D-arabinono-1,4-lactone oxidase [Auriculariales sp. MPI-PUGE-AT-0066]
MPAHGSHSPSSSSSSLTSHVQSMSLEDLSERVAAFTVHRPFTNWAGTFASHPLAVFEPQSLSDCQLAIELARRTRRTLRVVGVGHSPSDIACTSEYMLSTLKLNKLLSVDREKKLVVAQGGMILHTLNAILHENGLAMPILGSISEQTLGGVITTATHGTGAHFGVLSTLVLSLRLVLADGSVVTCSRDHEPALFLATLCGVGSTGLVLDACLQVEDAFCLREDRESIAFNTGVRCIDTISHSAEHVKMWWYPQSDALCVYRANRTSATPTPTTWHAALVDLLVGSILIEFLLFLGEFFANFNTITARFAHWLSSNPTTTVGISSKIFNLDSLLSQYTTEWAIPFENTQNCLRELDDWYQRELEDERGLRPHFPIEIRFSAADDILLSPSFGRRTTWIGIIHYRAYGRSVPYEELFAGFAIIMRRHGGRPHWAKQHSAGPSDFAVMYPAFEKFRSVVATVDPIGLWRAPYIQRCLFSSQPTAGSSSDCKK